tara:strand:- start:1428 stop:3905 length:2478 start_codon:yes stop_codon:yes gene_type:complete
MNGVSSKILGPLSSGRDDGQRPDLISEEVDWSSDFRGPTLHKPTEHEPLGRIPVPMPASENPFHSDYKLGPSSDGLPHYDSQKFLEDVWDQKISRPMNMLADIPNLGIGLYDMIRMIDHPKGRETIVDGLWTMMKGWKNYNIDHDIHDGILTPDGQVYAMAMEDLVQHFLDPDRPINEPFTAILDLMDGTASLLKGGASTAVLLARTKAFNKIMTKSRRLAKQGKIAEATEAFTTAMTPLRKEALGPDKLEYLERRLLARLDALYGRPADADPMHIDPAESARLIQQSMEERMALGADLYTYDTPDLKPKFREHWHAGLSGDIPQPHASLEDGLALAIEVYGPDPTSDEMLRAIEIIRTSDPKWRGAKDPTPAGVKNMLADMSKGGKQPMDNLRQIYASARAYALQMERVNPGSLDRTLNWYPEFASEIRKSVGEENFHEAAVLFGITSQQSPVEQNLTDTFWVMNEVRKYMAQPGVGPSGFKRADLVKWLVGAQADTPASQGVRHTIDKLTSYQKRKYDLKGAEGPLSVTRKEYKAFITKKDINKIADFYEDGVFKGNQKTQTYVGTLLHMMLGNGNGFFPWTTQDQHMARLFNVFKKNKKGEITDIGVFDDGQYRVAQYLTAKLARENGMSAEQMQALLWFYSKNVLAKDDKGSKALAGRLGSSPSRGGYLSEDLGGVPIEAAGYDKEFGTWESAILVAGPTLEDLQSRLNRAKALLPQIAEAEFDLQKTAFPVSLTWAKKYDDQLEKTGMPRRMTAGEMMKAKEQGIPDVSTSTGAVTSDTGLTTVQPSEGPALRDLLDLGELPDQSRQRQRAAARRVMNKK